MKMTKEEVELLDNFAHSVMEGIRSDEETMTAMDYLSKQKGKSIPEVIAGISYAQAVKMIEQRRKILG